MKYNEWTIIKEVEKKNGMRRVLAKCSCGKEKILYLKHLKSGTSKSCGHAKKEKMSVIGKNNCKYASYNVSNTRLYNIWRLMISRCYNIKNRSYYRYGGRGIKICDEWLNNFINFYNWALNNGYNESLSIDRIDNNGNYLPQNCRWATAKEQANNTRNCKGRRFLTLNGETKSVRDWSKDLNINYSTLSCRINRLGWDDEKALTYKKEDFIMKDKLEIEEVKFDEKLYEKNLKENDFSKKMINGIGDDENASD